MAFLRAPKPKASLTQALANKADALQVEKTFQAETAANFQAAAADALLQADVAHRHALAVDQAHQLLVNAGVDL